MRCEFQVLISLFDEIEICHSANIVGGWSCLFLDELSVHDFLIRRSHPNFFIFFPNCGGLKSVVWRRLHFVCFREPSCARSVFLLAAGTTSRRFCEWALADLKMAALSIFFFHRGILKETNYLPCLLFTRHFRWI